MDIDVTGLAGISVATALLAFVFRTLWRQDSGWRSLLEQERQAAVEARKEADEAREEATQARKEAAEARAEAVKARAETLKCQVEHEHTDRRLKNLIQQLRDAGIPLDDIPEGGST